jgi:hypothetical protein
MQFSIAVVFVCARSDDEHGVKGSARLAGEQNLRRTLRNAPWSVAEWPRNDETLQPDM